MDILALGHYASSSDFNKKAEILHTDREPSTWSTINDYPSDLAGRNIK